MFEHLCSPYLKAMFDFFPFMPITYEIVHTCASIKMLKVMMFEVTVTNILYSAAIFF